jgi:hypothetical protein
MLERVIPYQMPSKNVPFAAWRFMTEGAHRVCESFVTQRKLKGCGEGGRIVSVNQCTHSKGKSETSLRFQKEL